MAVENQQFAQARSPYPLANPGPEPDQVAGIERQRSGKGQMLMRGSDCLCRQNDHGRIGRQQRAGGGDDAFIDEDIGAERQMRPVLFDRRDRQDCDGIAQRVIGKIHRRKRCPLHRELDQTRYLFNMPQACHDKAGGVCHPTSSAGRM